MRLIFLSDTHLADDRSFFVPNFEALVAHVAGSRAAFVVNGGDVALDGADHEGHIAHARALHDRLVTPWRAIPGNHDLGNVAGGSGRPPRQPITNDRRARWCRHFSDEWWTADLGDWTLVGLNAQLMGSGLPTEEVQWRWLDGTLAAAAPRPVVLFTHRPLFNEAPAQEPGEHGADGRYLAPEPRRRLLDGIARSTVRLVASGHAHQQRYTVHDGVGYLWAPSTAFFLPEAMQPTIGTREVGFVDIDLTTDRPGITMRRLPTMAQNVITDFPEAYPSYGISRTKPAAAM